MRETFEQPNFETKRAVITGGTEGIGRAIAEDLAYDNNEVAVCARTKNKLEEVKAGHQDIYAFEVDLADRHQAARFIDNAKNELEGIDLLILNAAVTGVPHQGETPEQTEDRKTNIFKVNEVAQVALVRAAAEELRKNNGTVVFMTSGLARKSMPGTEDYGHSKKRIEEYLADFMNRPGNEGINYFSVNPGPVDTRMHEEIAAEGVEPLATMSRVAKEKGILSNPEVIGRIISKMSVSNKKFNPETNQYDLPIERGEIVDISKENIVFESTEK